ncbi:MAG TPA: hypothetical protein VME17_00530 [Bryobacteraceae bacterium]|nr:hypothetical protein [Bryobacteraceae bacterium]
MAVLRRVALGLVLAASAAVLLLAALELWNYRQWAYLPLHEPGLNEDDRGRILQDRMDLLSNRVGDMEKLVLILLGTSGLYAIVFVLSSYVSATSLSRQADQTVNQIQNQIGLAMGDLRELQERTEQSLKDMLAAAGPPAAPAIGAAPLNHSQQLAEIAARVAQWLNQVLGEESKQALLRDENSAAHLEAVAGPDLGAQLPALYLDFARIYAQSDAARSQFYLDRALRLAPPKSALASEVHYELACRWAASHQFPQAIEELTEAFQHQFLALEERLASDIDEGGQLSLLASTPPFDKAVNDLLLNISIGMG